ncbi:MAG: hypothetical protein ACKV19_11455 [Verrucomicrobiales bacterium]
MPSGTSSPESPSLLRRPGCWITFLTAVPLVVGGMYAIENWLGVRELARVKREMAAAGIVLDAHRLSSSRPPDADNFFGTPLLLALSKGTTSSPEYRSIERLARWSDWMDNFSPAPGHSMPAPQHPAPADWAVIRDAIAAKDRSSGLVKGGPQPLLEITAVLDRELAVIMADLEAALPRPHAVLVPTLQDRVRAGERVDDIYAEEAAVRYLATAVHFRARTDLASARLEQAASDTRILLRLAEGTEAFGTGRSAIIGSAIRMKAASTTWAAAVSQGSMPRQAWSELSAAHRTGASLERIAQALHGEMIVMDHSARMLRADPPRMAEVFLGIDMHGSMQVEQWKEWLVRFGPPGWIDFNVAGALEGNWQLRQRFEDPAHVERFNSARNRSWARDWLESRSLAHGLIARRSLHGLVTSATMITRSAMLSRLAETACALEAFHADHGDYPAALAALGPGYWPGVPDDLDGKPLRYALDPHSGRYKIWSIGEDGVDEGGLEKSGLTGPRSHPPLRWVEPVGDWVWHFPK